MPYLGTQTEREIDVRGWVVGQMNDLRFSRNPGTDRICDDRQPCQFSVPPLSYIIRHPADGVRDPSRRLPPLALRVSAERD